MVTTEWREEKMKSDCLMDIGFPFGVMKCLDDGLMTVQPCEILNATELYMLK